MGLHLSPCFYSLEKRNRDMAVKRVMETETEMERERDRQMWNPLQHLRLGPEVRSWGSLHGEQESKCEPSHTASQSAHQQEGASKAEAGIDPTLCNVQGLTYYITTPTLRFFNIILAHLF